LTTVTPAQVKPFLNILGQTQAAARPRGGREDDRIPDAQLMVRCEIGRRQHDFGRGFDNGRRIAPAQQSVARVAARLSAFANKHIEKLAQNLHRHDRCFLRESANEGERGVTLLRSVDPFRVGEHIGIERDPHEMSS
jgi:hypothetical protein